MQKDGTELGYRMWILEIELYPWIKRNSVFKRFLTKKLMYCTCLNVPEVYYASTDT
jgi:hypothetical protein